MSGLLREKINRLESLDERERTVLDFIMADKDIKIIDISNQMHLGESTTRNILTAVFNKLGVPSTERDKRGYVVREYAEAYREKYLKVDLKPEEPKGPSIEPEKMPEIPDDEPEVEIEPEIYVKPEERRSTIRYGAMLIILVSAIVLLLLASYVFDPNHWVNPRSTEIPTNAPYVAATATIDPTSTPSK